MTERKRILSGGVAALALIAGLSAGGATGDASELPAEAAAPGPTIALDPSAVPGPIDRDHPATVQLTLETVEREAEIADGTRFRYWTFNGRVPGPFVRVRAGDTVDVALKNPEDSMMSHSVDFHAVTGPGGGAVATQTMPGDETGFRFKAMKPGVYVYHCATPSVADHIQAGMYGLIVVEPEEGLPPVDRELYVMQGEIYTDLPLNAPGEAYTDYDKLLDEDPEYYVFNGSARALTGENAMTAAVGETVRIFFGVGGPNKTSSFHVIGEIFDTVHPFGSLASPVVEDVQTVTVAPGGATIAEVTFEVPGTYLMVDHALSRAERGLVAEIEVAGPENLEVFDRGERDLSAVEP